MKSKFGFVFLLLRLRRNKTQSLDEDMQSVFCTVMHLVNNFSMFRIPTLLGLEFHHNVENIQFEMECLMRRRNRA